MSRVVAILGKAVTSTHYDMLRHFIKDGLKVIDTTDDNRAECPVVSNRAVSVEQGCHVPCSDMHCPFLPHVIGFEVDVPFVDGDEEDAFTTFVPLDEATDETDTSNPVLEEMDMRAIKPFEMNDSDFVILIGSIYEFTQKEIDRSNVLVLTY